MTEEKIGVQNDAEIETIEIATTDVDENEKIGAEDTTAKDEKKESDDDYLLVVNDLKEYFPISKSLIKSNTVYLKAVDGVSLKLKAGNTIGIVGESGCGKTTLGRTILRLYEPTAGEVIFEGKHIEKLKGNALRKMRPNFQMIFQDPYSSLSPRMTVGEIVGEAVKVHHIVPKEQYKEYIVDIMTKCGLQPHYFDRYPHEFSGGQRQRICIAKALALKPKLVICDEPVSALDVSIQAQIINLFKDLQESDNLAYLFISHDLSVVEHISDEVGVMYLGNMVEYGSKREMFDNPLHPYTKALFSAVPVPDPDSKIKRIVLQGDIPSPANPPKGCKFHTRCSECMSACKLFQPKFTDLGGGHYVACHKYDQKVLDEMPFYDELVKLEDERNAEIDEMKAQKKQKKEDAANKIKELLKIKK
ncbi:MAG: dipeptide ABC transporter ATP-binding protein [Christensenella sp.]|nr:MAG: dipeptide ABC transporter ATP-binding protein [Christensenella sp.]